VSYALQLGFGEHALIKLS